MRSTNSAQRGLIVSNLDLWNAHRTPHKDALKRFKRGGGFSGTAIDPMWMIRAATEEWGPMGKDWGVKVLEEKYVEGHKLKSGDNAILHTVLIELRYPDGVVQAYGHTMAVTENKYGSTTDEEAPKKSLTDATNKALSMLGFGADVFMGVFDGNKYVDLRDEGEPAAPKKQPEPELEKKPKPDPIKSIKKRIAELEELVGSRDESVSKWVTFLKHCEPAEGALDLNGVLRLPLTKQWEVRKQFVEWFEDFKEAYARQETKEEEPF